MRSTHDLLAVCPVDVEPASAGAWLWIAAWESLLCGSDVVRCALAAVELAVDAHRESLGEWIGPFDLARRYLRGEGRLISDDLSKTFDQIVHGETKAPAKPRNPGARAAAEAIERLWYALEFGTIRSYDQALDAIPGRDQ
ncbi:MAG TPA: hypothetical protein VLB44_16660, partial [Kofleriaceae bacterium]|nr:hypothetical protein [Kofleriaceae bacterium]